MPWNEPGNNGNNNSQDPWGGKRNQNPPDLDKMIGDFLKKLRGFFHKGGNGNRDWPSQSTPSHKEYGLIASVLLFVLVFAWFVSGFFIVNPAEQAVVLRFGQFSEVLNPGLHWIARFVDTKYLIDVQKIYSFSIEGDFLTKSSEQGDLPNQVQIDAAKPSVANPDQSKNLVNVELNVQYRISDPRAYLFSVVDPDDTIQQVASGALSDVVGQMKLDDVLTTGRELLSSGVLDRVKVIINGYNTGLQVVAVTLRKVQAPDQVRAAFNDVNRADQDRATTIQQAQAYASKVVPIAQGEAARILADATAYQQQVVLNSQADVARYNAILSAYQASPDIVRERLYLETMQKILKDTSKVLVNVNNSNNLLYLPLDKIMSNQATPDNKIALSSPPAQPVTETHDETTTTTSDNNSNSTGTEVKNDTN